MRSRTLAFILLSVLHGSPPAAVAGAVPLEREAFGLTPRMEHVAISPDGKRLAWIDNGAATPHIVMFDIDSAKTRPLADLGDRFRPVELHWSDGETVLVEASVVHDLGNINSLTASFEMHRLIAVSTRGGPARMLLQGERNRKWSAGADLLALHPTDAPGSVIMSSFDYSRIAQEQRDGAYVIGRSESGWINNVFVVDTQSGKGKRIATGRSSTVEWVVDGEGAVRARADWDPSRNQYRVFARDEGGWRLILEREEYETWLWGVSSDRSAIVAAGAFDGPRSKAWLLPLDGSAPRVLLEDPAFEVDGILIDPYTLQPAGFRFGGAEQRREWFDPPMKQRIVSLERSFKGMVVDIESRSSDGNRVVATVNSPSRPTVYYLVDFAARKADIIGEEYPRLANQALGTVQIFEYTTRDGVPIASYLTLPAGKSASESLPLVVLPHDGPDSRDDYEFDWMAQFLASHGYAVFQPQYRGSTGFGEAHRIAGNRQWGRRMQDDITDGVQALIERRTADGKRICIAGIGYGGYAALAGAAFTPDLYACAVSINGIADLPVFLGERKIEAGTDSAWLAYTKELVGSERDRSVVEASPARAAARVQAPVLLIHGRDDTIVRIRQSRLMAKALARAGKSHTLVEIDADHRLSYDAARIRALAELETFLARHL